MPGNKKCPPGCTCSHHSPERREQRKKASKAQAEREGREKRSAQVAAVWERRTEEQRKQITAKAVAKRGKVRVSPEGVRKRAEATSKWWENLSKDEQNKHIMRAVSARGSWHMTDLEETIAAILTAFEIPYEFQYPIKAYCVDFYIPSLNLIIEADGTYWHTRPGEPERDATRDEELHALGYSVVRLREETIKQDALKSIVHTLLWGNAKGV